MNPSYTISPDGKSITCHQCGRTSHNPNDVQHRYCDFCKIWHDDDDHELHSDEHEIIRMVNHIARTLAEAVHQRYPGVQIGLFAFRPPEEGKKMIDLTFATNAEKKYLKKIFTGLLARQKKGKLDETVWKNPQL